MLKQRVSIFEASSAESVETMVHDFVNDFDENYQVVSFDHSAYYNAKNENVLYTVMVHYTIQEMQDDTTKLTHEEQAKDREYIKVAYDTLMKS